MKAEFKPYLRSIIQFKLSSLLQVVGRQSEGTNHHSSLRCRIDELFIAFIEVFDGAHERVLAALLLILVEKLVSQWHV